MTDGSSLSETASFYFFNETLSLDTQFSVENKKTWWSSSIKKKYVAVD